MDKESVIALACGLLIALITLSALLGWLWLWALRMRTVLHAWAAEGRYQILGFKKKNFTNRGPYPWWTNGSQQAIFRVRVRDREGRERIGWVRCGSYFGGVWFSNKAEVRWED